MESENATSADNQQERSGKSWWLTGFVDGEGTFSVNIFRNKTSKIGWQCFPEFVITQGIKSISVLKEIQNFLGCGNVYINRRNDNHLEDLAKFCVRSREDLKGIIIPFFEKYTLRTAKKQDFKNFSKIILLMNQNKHLSLEGLYEIAQIVEKMNHKKRSAYLKSSETTRQTPLKS